MCVSTHTQLIFNKITHINHFFVTFTYDQANEKTNLAHWNYLYSYSLKTCVIAYAITINYYSALANS